MAEVELCWLERLSLDGPLEVSQPAVDGLTGVVSSPHQLPHVLSLCSRIHGRCNQARRVRLNDRVLLIKVSLQQACIGLDELAVKVGEVEYMVLLICTRCRLEKPG